MFASGEVFWTFTVLGVLITPLVAFYVTLTCGRFIIRFYKIPPK
jgi:hypothetical protein